MNVMDGRRRQNPLGRAYELTEETPVYVISVAAQLSGLHPQTLRQ
jgi:MerR family transcriptional regulator, heat shock protein HspR